MRKLKGIRYLMNLDSAEIKFKPAEGQFCSSGVKLEVDTT